jgi:flavodoxin
MKPARPCLTFMMSGLFNQNIFFMEAIVIYHSKTGITKNFGNEISLYLQEKNIPSKVISVDEVKPEDILKCDTLFIGCWTSGLFLFAQHPDPEWKKYALLFPEMKNKKVAFFTTYKLATGSMFRKMEKVIREKLSESVHYNLKSKNGKLSEENKKQIQEFVKSA